MSKGEAVVEGNEVTLTSMPDSALESFKGAFKQREKAKPKLSGARSISTAGGIFSIGDEDLGTFMELCIIDWAFTNTFYAGAFNPSETRPPVCAAVGLDEHDFLIPHGADGSVEGLTPQHDACGDCPNNEWGSETQRHIGKACKNAVRLVVASADDVRAAQSAGQGAAQVATYYLNVPVTSCPELMKVISMIEGMLGEVCAAQTNVTNEVLAGGGYKLTFMPASTLFPSADSVYIGFLNSLMESVQTMLLAPPRTEEEEEAAPKPNKSSRRPGAGRGSGRVMGDTTGLGKAAAKVGAKKGARKKAAGKKAGVRRRRA